MKIEGIFMKIKILLLIAVFAGVVGSLSAMEDTILTLSQFKAKLNSKTLSYLNDMNKGVSYAGKKYEIKNIKWECGSQMCDLQRPVRLFKIFNWGTETIPSRNLEHDIVPGCTTYCTSYEPNYRNIFRDSLLLAAGVALIKFAWMYTFAAK